MTMEALLNNRKNPKETRIEWINESEHFDKPEVTKVSGNVTNIKLSSSLVIRPEIMSYHINLLNSYTIYNDFKNLLILFPSKVV